MHRLILHSPHWQARHSQDVLGKQIEQMVGVGNVTVLQVADGLALEDFDL